MCDVETHLPAGENMPTNVRHTHRASALGLVARMGTLPHQTARLVSVVARRTGALAKFVSAAATLLMRKADTEESAKIVRGDGGAR